MIESQELVATRGIVNSLAKQALLESLLEDHSKPTPTHYPRHRHHLLSAPFRYPPLRYGSRFGTRNQPSLFYGALQSSTVVAECAYYRFVFWRDMQPPPREALDSEHTMFSVGYHSERAVDLAEGAFASLRDRVSHPSDYSYSQALGEHLRSQHVTCFLYQSARDPQGGTNVGIFEPQVLADSAPRCTWGWSSKTQANRVDFFCIRTQERYQFAIEQFCPRPGEFPSPG